MATLEINVKNNLHRISCKDGEEKHLQALVEKFVSKVDVLSKSLPTADDKTIYLIAGLTFVDELEELKKLKPKSSTTENKKQDELVDKSINMAAEKIENLIKKIGEYNTL